MLPAAAHAVVVLRHIRQKEEGLEGTDQRRLVFQAQAGEQLLQPLPRAGIFLLTQPPGELAHLLQPAEERLALLRAQGVPQHLAQGAHVRPQRRLSRQPLTCGGLIPLRSNLESFLVLRISHWRSTD